jgi:hypothetical protein
MTGQPSFRPVTSPPDRRSQPDFASVGCDIRGKVLLHQAQ